MTESNIGNSQKVLIVDDEPYVLRVLQLKLNNAGYEVVTAINGEDGLGKFIKEKPKLVITDIRMPLMDGQEMYQMMKEQSGSRPFFVIMMTSTIDQSLHLWAGKMGNIHFVEKPVSPRNILKLVEKYYASVLDSNAKF